MPEPKSAVQATSVPEAKAPEAPATSVPVATVQPKAMLSVVFSRPTWQSKSGTTVRKADVQLLGAMPALPLVAIAGITVAQDGREIIIFMPSASKVGPAKAITPRMVAFTQTIDGDTVSGMAPTPRGQRQIDKLESAIIDAWADANASNGNPYDRELPLTLE